MGRIQVLVVDDHQLFRAGLRRLIERARDMEVVGEAGSGDGAAVEAEASRPDVVLLDLAMPRMSGLEAIELIRKVSPDSRILVLTMFDDAETVRSAIDAGASGFLTKSRSEKELLGAIRRVHAGSPYLGEEERAAEDEERPALSRRERQVLSLIARGHTYREIAEKLDVSIRSVETYRERLAQKLGLDSRAELVRYALDHGLLLAGRAPDL